jgi:hypothetical protein
MFHAIAKKFVLVAGLLGAAQVAIPPSPAQAQRQGWTVVHLTHGQWVAQTFYFRQDALDALAYYRSLGIPAYMR